jgi:hypothetical protein
MGEVVDLKGKRVKRAVQSRQDNTHPTTSLKIDLPKTSLLSALWS